jgi:hypothetical protein
MEMNEPSWRAPKARGGERSKHTGACAEGARERR